MTSFTTTTSTYVVSKYSRAYSQPGTAAAAVPPWEHFTSPRLRVALNIVTPSTPTPGIRTRYRLKVYDESPAVAMGPSQGAGGETVWEDLDLTSFSEIHFPTPVAGMPLKAVYKGNLVGFRYLHPLTQPNESCHRRFQIVFTTEDAASALVQAISPVCPCQKAPAVPTQAAPPQAPVTTTTTTHSATASQLFSSQTPTQTPRWDNLPNPFDNRRNSVAQIPSSSLSTEFSMAPQAFTAPSQPTMDNFAAPATPARSTSLVPMINDFLGGSASSAPSAPTYRPGSLADLGYNQDGSRRPSLHRVDSSGSLGQPAQQPSVPSFASLLRLPTPPPSTPQNPLGNLKHIFDCSDDQLRSMMTQLVHQPGLTDFLTRLDSVLRKPVP